MAPLKKKKRKLTARDKKRIVQSNAKRTNLAQGRNAVGDNSPYGNVSTAPKNKKKKAPTKRVGKWSVTKKKK